jgi:HSP20 family molecular chaperone IbpA
VKKEDIQIDIDDDRVSLRAEVKQEGREEGREGRLPRAFAWHGEPQLHAAGRR